MTLVRVRHAASLVAFVLIWGAVAWWLVGCASNGTSSPQAKQVIYWLCQGDAAVQPIVVPIIVMASPLAGPAAPGIAVVGALDQAVLHPLIVKACADHGTKPVAPIDTPPPGIPVTAPVAIMVPAKS